MDSGNKKSFSAYDIKYTFIFLLILSVISALFIYATACGINLTYDSGIYIRWAKTIGGNPADYFTPGPEYFHWPPLFSYIIFLLKIRTGIGYSFMQFIFLVINFLLLILIGNKTLNHVFTKITWTAITCTGVSFLMIHVFLWSEPFFLLILSGLILLMDRYLKKGKPGILLIAILLSNLLCLQRNAGIFILFGIMAAILWYIPGKKGVLTALIYIFPSMIAFILWNFIINGSGDIFQMSFFSDFLHNIINYFNDISAWLVPRLFNHWLRILFLLVILLFIISNRTYSRHYRDPSGVFIYLIIIYILGISSLGKIDSYESERYLSVIYPGFILLFMKSISAYWHRIRFSFRIVLAIFLLIWFSYTVSRSLINAGRWHAASCQATYSR